MKNAARIMNEDIGTQTPVDENIHQATAEVFGISDEDIKSKTGNYIFTVGNVGCGKSTLQNLLMYRLWGREDIKLDYSNKDGDHRHDKILNDWVTSLGRGDLPKRTAQGLLQEFNVTISQESKKALSLNFLEISGEDIKSIVPTLSKDEKPKLNSQLIRYLETSKSQINKRFIFVSDAEENRKNKNSSNMIPEDILFNEFLRYVLGKNGLAMKKIQVLFIAAKWDVVAKEYSSVQQYFKKNFPQTRAILKSERCDTTFIPFSVGTIEDVIEHGHKSDLDAQYVQKIVSLESKHVDFLIQWIYHSFTGNTLRRMPKINRTFLDKLKALFS